MTILQALVYGAVQGITEFLPISSTAHLVLIPRLLGWQDPGAAFDVAMHLGTAAAVIIYFFGDWVKLVSAGFGRPKSNEGRLFWLIALATVPGGIFGILFDRYMESFRNTALIGVMLIIMGAVLYISDKTGRTGLKLRDISARSSLVIGFSQLFAILPGVSRSGITMSAGRFLGFDRNSAAKFTFLMSTPLILGQGLYKLKDIMHSPVGKAPFLAALAASFMVGMLSIGFLMNYLRKKSLGIFTVYRSVLGAFLIAANFLGWI